MRVSGHDAATAASTPDPPSQIDPVGLDLVTDLTGDTKYWFHLQHHV
jgi:hypothetical protein